MNIKKYSLSVFKIIDVIYNCRYFTKNEILYLMIASEIVLQYVSGHLLPDIRLCLNLKKDRHFLLIHLSLVWMLDHWLNS